MIAFGLGFLLVFGIPSGLLGWFIARRRPGWSKASVVFLAALPTTALACIAGISCILYGMSIKGTCGYDDCGGFILIGMLMIAASLMGYAFGLVFAVVGAVVERAGEKPAADPREVFD